jgi:hypothetical protein
MAPVKEGKSTRACGFSADMGTSLDDIATAFD